MLRKIVFVLIALALPLVAASAVSAQQYPPSGEDPASATLSSGASSGASRSAGAGSEGVSRSGGSGGTDSAVLSESVGSGGGAGSGTGVATAAPLAQTGTDLTLPAGAALVLLAGGALALVASRRRTATA